jgi:hypothetical protein
MFELYDLTSHSPLAASAITWTPVTFYVAMGIIHTLIVLIGFRIMQVDAEHNSFIGALLAAAVFNVVAYFVRDTGVIGVMITGAAIFGMLVMVSSGEALKAFFMTMIVIASYGVVGSFIVSRTPLNMDDIAGFPRVVTTGGLEPEPITEEDNKRLEKTGIVD